MYVHSYPFHPIIYHQHANKPTQKAYYAIDLSQPQLSWILSSKASELCQTLGFHRLASYKKSDDEISIQQKQSLFWAVYIADKGLALRLGRASTVQDYDVTVPYPASEGRSSNPIAMFLRGWVLVAHVQGQIYERLYCPEAIGLSEGVRYERVQALAGELREIESFMCEATVGLSSFWCWGEGLG